jgi:hypothetical protein
MVQPKLALPPKAGFSKRVRINTAALKERAAPAEPQVCSMIIVTGQHVANLSSCVDHCLVYSHVVVA